MLGIVGRESQHVVLSVCRTSQRRELEPAVLAATKPQAQVHTDEWVGYGSLDKAGREHRTVRHKPPHPEWARDDDGDGVREVHCNTIEGLWTGLRNFLRPFRGVSKWYLSQYVAIFEWGYCLKTATDAILRLLLLGIRPSTDGGT